METPEGVPSILSENKRLEVGEGMGLVMLNQLESIVFFLGVISKQNLGISF